MSALPRPSAANPLGPFLALSVAVHAVVYAIAGTSWQWTRTPPPSIEVELAPVGGDGRRAAAGAQSTPPAAPRSETSKPAAVAKSPAKAATKPQRVDAKPLPAAAVPAKATAAKPAERPAAESAVPAEHAAPRSDLGDIRRMLDAKRAAAGGTGTGAAGTDAPGAEGAGDGFGLPTGVAGRLYFSQVVAAVRAAWAVPPGSRRQPVQIDVLIGGDGRVQARSLRQSSGDALLDRSAVAALDAADIPAPPSDMRAPLKLTLELIPPEE